MLWDLTVWLRNLGSQRTCHASSAQGRKGIRSLDFSMPFISSLPLVTLRRVHIFLYLPSAANLSAKALLEASDDEK